MPTATPTQAPTGDETPTATPTATRSPLAVRLNEVLPNPRTIDWDGRAPANPADEWIELYNPGPRAADLTGWSITVQVQGRRAAQTYRFARKTTLAADGYLVLFQRDTRLVLDNQTATIRLLDASGQLVDAVTYEMPEPDESLSWGADGEWHPGWPPTPGEANEEPATMLKRPVRVPATATPARRRP